MAQRHRALPSWMAKKEEKVKKTEPLKSRKQQKTARAVFYCMDEKELVEAAVSYLTDAACVDGAPLTDRKVGDKAADASVNPASSKTTAKLVTLEEESSDCGDDLETTYVSETDLDISEEETLLYTKSMHHQEPEGQRSDQDHVGLRNVGPEAESKEERSRMTPEAAEEDDEALRLVREIFFT